MSAGALPPEVILKARVQHLEDEVNRLRYDALRQISKLKVLNEIGRAIASVLDRSRALDLICELVTANLDCDLSSVMLLEEGGTLVLRAARGIPEEIARTVRVKVGSGYAGRVAATGKPFLMRDDDPEATVRGRFSPDDSRSIRYQGGSFAIVPILLEGSVLGVVNVTNKRDGNGLAPADVEFLETVASWAAVAIENSRLHEKAQLLAATDGLTELYNHRHFQERLAAEIERHRRYRLRGVGLVMVDIDHFKRFNDTWGHRAGDAVLRECALRLRRAARRVDVCCRYGGEEMVVILPEVDRNGAWVFAERVRDAMEREPFRVGDAPVRLTVSVGLSAHPEDSTTAADLIEAADRALYVSKRAGRNRVTLAGRTEPESGPPPTSAAFIVGEGSERGRL